MRKLVWVVVVVLVLAVVYFSFDPSRHAVFPKCPFLMVTGLKCPGCGSQRAIHSLLHFDFVQAFRYNALLVLSLPLLAVLLTGEALRTRYPAFYRRINNTKAIITLLVVVMAWWALRNVFGW